LVQVLVSLVIVIVIGSIDVAQIVECPGDLVHLLALLIIALGAVGNDTITYYGAISPSLILQEVLAAVHQFFSGKPCQAVVLVDVIGVGSLGANRSQEYEQYGI
jgi:hypothetical protein